MLGLGLGLPAQARWHCRRWRSVRRARCAEERLSRRLHPLRHVRARLSLRHSRTGEAGIAGGERHAVFHGARSGPCEMCEDIPCVKACPTGALDHSLTDINKARDGARRALDQETCLNFLGLRCDVCYRVCPVIDKAITLELRPNVRTGRHTMFIPTVHSEHCTGCGKCENACVTEEASIKVLPRRWPRGSLGEHYRLGWEEKKKAAATR
jgi:Fe-S-cluster-containing hydrogenase component 2